jgi:WD40 repeat protein
VWCAKFSPLGKYLVTGSGDGKLMIYDVVDNFKFITQLESSPDEEKAVFSSGPKPSGNAKSIVHCCWDPREEYIVSCCFDTMVRVWYVGGLKNPDSNKRRSTRFSNEPKGYKLVSCFTLGDSIRIWSCAFLPDTPNTDPRFVLGSPDKVLKLYDIHGIELFDFHGNIYETNFHEDSISDDLNMQEADLDEDHDADEEATSNSNEFEQKKVSKIKEDKNIDKQLLSYFNRIVDVAISPNGKILITIDRNKQLQFFAIPEHFGQDATTTRIVKITLGSCGTSCTVSKNGKYLLLSIGPEELQVWDIGGLTEYDSENYEMPILYRKFYAHNHGDCTIRSSFGYLVEDANEEELVLSGSHDGFVYVWKLHTGQIITRLNAHEGTCNMVDWNLSGPNSTKKNGRDYGKLWCSVGDDKNVKIWGPSDWE